MMEEKEKEKRKREKIKKKKEAELKREMENYSYSQALWGLCDGTFKSKCPTVKLQRTKWPIMSLLGFQYLLYLLHSCMIWRLILIG